MSSRPTSKQLKTEQLAMDSFFDFSQGTEPSPVTGSSSKLWDTASPQQFSGPSHDYQQYKQQVGLPMGVSNVPPQLYDSYNTGIDMSFEGSWSTGIDMDNDVPMDFNNMDNAPMFFPNSTPVDTFVNPNNLNGAEEPVGRVWPGMHSQQAAMQKASSQQRQMKTQYQQQQIRQTPQQAPVAQAPIQKRHSHIPDPQVEERITRLLNQMRQNNVNANDESSPSDLLPHIARLKKDEEDMDEDERLLASEEGKKLTSKERRQLRNKVSARAFRSRRKEYIGQLEGEVAVKAQEAATLRVENDALIQENERYRGFIETILRHPAFGPFMNDLSKDPSMLGLTPAPQQHQPQVQQAPPAPQPSQQQQMQEDTKPAFLNFDASQIQVPGQQSSERVQMAKIPENDFSKLNLNGFNQDINFNDYRSVNAFAVTNLPSGPEVASLFSNDPSQYSSSTVYARDNSMDLLLARLDSAASRTRA